MTVYFILFYFCLRGGVGELEPPSGTALHPKPNPYTIAGDRARTIETLRRRAVEVVACFYGNDKQHINSTQGRANQLRR